MTKSKKGKVKRNKMYKEGREKNVVGYNHKKGYGNLR